VPQAAIIVNSSVVCDTLLWSTLYMHHVERDYYRMIIFFDLLMFVQVWYFDLIF
jgi:hypothetical protein